MKKIRALFILPVIMMLLAACNLPGRQAQPVEPSGPNAVQTAAALTVEAFATQLEPTTAVGDPTEANNAQPTAVPPTDVPSPTQPLPTVKPTEATPCDRASFVADVTIPDGTELESGEDFTKTWRLKNNGTCTWTTSYALVFASGNALNGPVSQPLPKSVAPGETVEVSVNLTAPSTPGTYRGDWRLRNASSAVFGIGDKADKPFYVEIVVGEPFFAVTSASTTVDQSSFSGACPHEFNFEAKIKVAAAGTVTYRWERSDGAQTSWKSLSFDEAGEKTITTSWTFGGAGNSYNNYWIRLYVDEPNHQYFPKAEFSLTCDP